MKERLGRIARSVGFGLLAAAVGVAAPRAAAAASSLALDVSQSIGEPGGVVAVVVRTYASRPIGQGQLCFRVESRTAPLGLPADALTADAVNAATAASGPFASFVGYRVFSDVGDATSSAHFDGTGPAQIFMVQFASVSASVNRSDGPLAVFYFRLRDDLQPRQRFTVEIDLPNTWLIDARGREVPIRPRDGRLTVRAPGDPYAVEADGAKVAAGAIAELGVVTFEPVAMAGGRVGFRYDPAIAAAPPVVLMNPRYGASSFEVDNSTPGLALISFTSADHSFNLVPGEVITLLLPTRPGIPAGASSQVVLDRALTYFEDPAGGLLPFTMEGGTVTFR